MGKIEPRTEFYLDQNFWQCWQAELNNKIYWYDISEDFAWHLLEDTVQAYLQNSEYYFQGMDKVELTKIYEQCKLVSLLSKEYNG